MNIVFGQSQRSGVRKELTRHFEGLKSSQIVTASRQFQPISRVDLQSSLEEFFGRVQGAKLVGMAVPQYHETIPLAHLHSDPNHGVGIAPLQHDDVDVGDATPVRCLKNGLWMAKVDGIPVAVLLSPSIKHGMTMGVHLEIATPAGDEGARVSDRFFREIEQSVQAGKTYRGRVLSLEAQHNFFGAGGTVKVHRLRTVKREDVILPQRTLDLLERNTSGFAAVREGIKELRLSAKKGLLFYGPPGTGKTHTIHYLASQMPGHTTLLVTAEQVAFVGEYFRLARFLQPAIMVIEDVDLIARERGGHAMMPGQEALLNKLLNEMDGLREDADVIFILTTNRPDQLEPALASRPGRVDQAIEFPLPDEEGRAKLVALYAGGLVVPEDVRDLIVRRSKGVSAAFIKELMRRSAQFHLESGRGNGALNEGAVNGAFEEMVFAGGALNSRLLGGEAVALDRARSDLN